MDKEAFLHQLEFSLANNDKRLFAKTIYDLPADVIVGFTKEELSKIIYISHLFSLQNMGELCDFLETRGTFSINNALKGIDELNSSLLSKFYFSIYISLSENDVEKAKSVFINYAIACGKLAEMNIENMKNFELATDFFGKARQIFPKNSLSHARASMNEGNIRVRLAEIDINSRCNLEIAISLYTNSRHVFSKESKDYAAALMNEGNARQILAEIGIDFKEKGIDIRGNLETAVSLYIESQKIFSKEKRDPYARTLMNEGNARLRLAEIDVDSRKNLKTAINLYSESRKIFSKDSADYASALMNEGTAKRTLVGMNIKIAENFERSKELYLESISILEKLGNGWIYSFALLNLNSLLIDYFYKTGEKKYLEEWEKNLGDIEKKIKDRDIRYKEHLMARIHEIRASLLEFDGDLGIYNASLEYYKAYEVSNEIFYKFMKDFCQARIVKPSVFCNLVSDWKDIGKEDIFLDYYDYAIFECHLENALKSSISEEDELKLAVEKLREIRDRTQIKIIKDRVSAYIHLLQALVDCFNKDSYKEAAENVKEGCKIFREYGDKQGQQMCEIFHNAVVKKTNPNAWQEIIRNREFSSNFYNLLCEYSDRKRANLEFYMSGQLYTKVNTISENVEQIKEISINIKNKIDEILNQIRSGFTEIEDQIEKGFKGTDAEFLQIKCKVDSSQQDLEYLVQVSDNVDRREGECIREFSLQMLELMKKGDYEAVKRFNEKIIQNSSSIIEIIEAANIPERQKVEAKSKLADLKKISGILKEKARSFSVDVTKDVVVTLTSGEIIKLLTPVLSTAVFGVPIPSQIVGILLETIRN